jgi:formyltetrahydrofolate hydrolase
MFMERLHNVTDLEGLDRNVWNIPEPKEEEHREQGKKKQSIIINTKNIHCFHDSLFGWDDIGSNFSSWSGF